MTNKGEGEGEATDAACFQLVSSHQANWTLRDTRCSLSKKILDGNHVNYTDVGSRRSKTQLDEV